MTHEISNYDDVIDSRDVISRTKELEQNTELEVALGNVLETGDQKELEDLKVLAEDVCSCVDDWDFGIMLIRDSYFKEYAQELAENSGALDKELKWPNTCIDWDQATKELKMDYMAVEFGNQTYWVQ